MMMLLNLVQTTLHQTLAIMTPAREAEGSHENKQRKKRKLKEVLTKAEDLGKLETIWICVIRLRKGSHVSLVQSMSFWLYCYWSTLSFLFDLWPNRCRFNHDIQNYLSQKPRDLRIPKTSEIQNAPPFYITSAEDEISDSQYACLNPNTSCPVHNELGDCK
jgi:hypothetical protein